MAEIRLISEQEFDECLGLSQYAFQYELPKSKIENKKENLKKQIVWGEFEGEQLLSKVHVIPFEIFIEEKEFAMGGIASVATWPEHRRNGSVARLIRKSLETMKDNGQTVSMLHPFSIPFYRKFGFELTMVRKKMTIETKDLHFMKETEGRIKRYHKDDGYEIVTPIYESNSRRYNGLLKRDNEWWEKNVYSISYQTAVYFDKAMNPMGYILYKVKEEKMDIQEFIYLNHEARRGLWNFICQHDSMIQKVEMILPESDGLPLLLHNPKVKQEIDPYFMSRIVDIAGFLERYQLPGSLAQFAIHVTDTAAEWNNGVIMVDQHGAKFSSETSFENVGNTTLVLKTDIQSLSAMFLGGRRPLELYETEQVMGEEIAVTRFETWLPHTKPAFMDFF